LALQLVGAQEPPGEPPSGFGPADLRSAYAVTSSGGDGVTVGIVDAYDQPHAETDLATYRSTFGLPPCTTDNGCFRKVDQRGGTSYPAADYGWGAEIDLDIEMVSAICPNCHILLVEADTASLYDLPAAVDTAVALGAVVVSNSYGGYEIGAMTGLESHYIHAGVPIFASSGDSGYGVLFPASSGHVVSVGGTSLAAANNARGWTETAWLDTGSGCSAYFAKPVWQSDAGCSNRTVADVAAVADPTTGVAAFDPDFQGWGVWGGTSAASPIVAAMAAIAHSPNSASELASDIYANSAYFNDVTSGANGACNSSYLCTAGPGYDGPTGLGTPNGVSAFGAFNGIRIRGTVTGPGGAPLAKIQVTASSGAVHYSAVTAADGTFAVAVIAGTYTLSFLDPSAQYAGGYYASSGYTVDAASATPVVGTTGDVTGIDVQLPADAVIRGTVTGSGGAPFSGIAVAATAGPLTLKATTGLDGNYEIPVPPGSYTVSFTDSIGGQGPGYYSSSGFVPDAASATQVVVGTADVAGISVRLPWAPGQTWTRQFGPATTSGVAVDGAGNIAVIGEGFLRLYRWDGALLWSRPFEGEANAVAVDRAGNIAVGGKGVDSALLTVYAPDGTERWSRQFSPPDDSTWSYGMGTFINGIAADAAGDIAVVGQTSGTLPGQTKANWEGVPDTDAFVRLYSPDGSELWTRQFGTQATDTALGVAADPWGNIVVVGNTDGTLPGQLVQSGGAFVRAFAHDGSERWTRQFGAGYEVGSSVAVDQTGHVLVTGYTFAGGDQTWAAFLRRFDPDGTEDWARQFDDSSSGVAVDPAGNAVVVGTTQYKNPAGLNVQDIVVRTFGRDGSQDSRVQFGSGVWDLASGIAVDAGGNVVVSGSTWGTMPGQTSSGNEDGFVRRIGGTDPGPTLTVMAYDRAITAGDPLPQFEVAYSGFGDGDTPASLDGTLAVTTTADTGSPAGTYPITPSGLTSAKYRINYVPGTLTMTPAAPILTVTAVDTVKYYGDPMPALAASYSGFVDGDTPSSLGGTLAFTTTAFDGSPVGRYPITPWGLESSKYAIRYVTGTLTIPKLAETLRIDPAGTTGIRVGGTFSVKVVESSIVPTTGVQASVTFDQNLLQITSVTVDQPYVDAAIVVGPTAVVIARANATGKLTQMAAALLPPDTIAPGDADFLTITFKAIASGATDLGLPVGPLDAALLDGRTDRYGLALPVATTGGTVTICGATATQSCPAILNLESTDSVASVTRQAQVVFGSTWPSGLITLTSGNSSQALADLESGAIQLAGVTRPLTTAEKASLYAWQIGSDAMTIAVHDSPEMSFLSDITTAQVRDIYDGSDTYWDQDGLGGPHLPIVARSDALGSDTRDDLLRLFGVSDTSEQATIAATGLSRLTGRSDEAAAALNDYQIVYTSLTNVASPGLKPLALNGMTPNVQTVQNGTYPAIRQLFLVVRKAEVGGRGSDSAVVMAEDYVNFLSSPAGQGAVAAAGFVQVSAPATPPIPDWDIDLDGVVGLSDLGIVTGAWAQTSTIPGWIRADVNNDGAIGLADIGAIMRRWGATGFVPPK
jgi:ABC-type phosphate transport system substrate-binding protein